MVAGRVVFREIDAFLEHIGVHGAGGTLMLAGDNLHPIASAESVVETHALEGIVLVGAGAIKACQSVPQTAPKFPATVLDQKNVTGKLGTISQVHGTRKTHQYEWERTSNPLCLVTSGVGGFDSLALPPNDFRHEISRFQPIRKPPTITIGSLFLPGVDQTSTEAFWMRRL